MHSCSTDIVTINVYVYNLNKTLAKRLLELKERLDPAFLLVFARVEMAAHTVKESAVRTAVKF